MNHWGLPRKIARPGIDPVEARRLNGLVRELRAARLCYRDISVVLDLYEGYTLTEDDVRSWCRRLGLPKNATRSAAMKRTAAERQAPGVHR